ncbi:MAG: hypothetical protein LH624_11345, partial [Cryobacterium sp.]|nr:hypothetical protein [Cryobacterium sp.]
ATRANVTNTLTIAAAGQNTHRLTAGFLVRSDIRLLYAAMEGQWVVARAARDSITSANGRSAHADIEANGVVKISRAVLWQDTLGVLTAFSDDGRTRGIGRG